MTVVANVMVMMVMMIMMVMVIKVTVMVEKFMVRLSRRLGT